MINPIYQLLVPAGVLSIGTYLRNRDKDNVGADDALGRVITASAPAVTLALDGENNVPATKKVLTAIRDAAQAGLDSLG